MLRQFQIPNIEIPAETQTLLRRQFASKALPGGEPADTFISQPDGRHEIRAWSDALWTGVQAVYRIAVGDERNKVSRLQGLANLDQALRIIAREVRADTSVSDAEKEAEAMRRAYRLGVAQVEMKAAISL